MKIADYLNESCAAILEAAVTEIPFNDIENIIDDNELAKKTIKEYFAGDKFVGVSNKNPEAIEILDMKFSEHGVFEDIKVKGDDKHFYANMKIYNDKNVGYVAYIKRNSKTYYIWNT